MVSDISPLLAFLAPVEEKRNNCLQVLHCFAIRGIAAADQAAVLTGLTYQAAYKALNQLTHPVGDTPPALRAARFAPKGKAGQPRKVFLLTEAGASALRKLGGDQKLVRPSRLEAHVEIEAACMMMDVYTEAYKARFPASVEHLLRFGDGHNAIRADVLVTLGRQKVIFECEQSADRSSLPRLVDKLLHLVHFFESPEAKGISKQVRLIFNIHPSDTSTLAIWQEALGHIAQSLQRALPFELHWQRMTEFLANPEWQTVKRFQRMQVVVAEPIEPSNIGDELLSTLRQQGHEDLKEMGIVLSVLHRQQQETFEAYQRTQDHRERSHRFFDLMLQIYEASHGRYSPTETYSAFPVESLYLLRRYLHAHQNKELFEELKTALDWAHQHDQGVVRFRNAMTRVIWDVFLRHQGFGRGGPLRVAFLVPDFGDSRSDFYVHVWVAERKMFRRQRLPRFDYNKQEPEEEALAWVLEALVLYAYELGLGEHPWRTARKSRVSTKKGNENDDAAVE